MMGFHVRDNLKSRVLSNFLQDDKELKIKQLPNFKISSWITLFKSLIMTIRFFFQIFMVYNKITLIFLDV